MTDQFRQSSKIFKTVALQAEQATLLWQHRFCDDDNRGTLFCTDREKSRPTWATFRTTAPKPVGLHREGKAVQQP